MSTVSIPVFGLTGGIGSGKSTVRRILQELGETIIDADDLAREVVQKGSESLQQILTVFDPSVITTEGELDRTALGKVVFSDPYRLKLLERIIHPEIESLFQTFVLGFQLAGISRVFYELPLLFEKHQEGQFRATILVTCPLEDRVTRVMARNGLSEEDVRKRMSSQLSDLDKKSKATYIISNDSDLESLHQQTLQIQHRIIQNNLAC